MVRRRWGWCLLGFAFLGGCGCLRLSRAAAPSTAEPSDPRYDRFLRRSLAEAAAVATGPITNETQQILEAETDSADAVLFPSFCVTIGAVVYVAQTRLRPMSYLPYTALMFLMGTFMGIGTSLLATKDNSLNNSIQMWTTIDSEVLLLVFLPGLIFKDAVGLNVHLFRVSFWQNLMFAVPMVLAGTTLTALVAFYLFPYDWSFNLCMTFGSILSATDPVAVAALLNELGAPPRLKIHISGEALLNDGSAIVFYSIFVLRYLYEFGIAGIGEDVDVARGFALFFRKSLGGAAAGLFFGLAILVTLKVLNRRFSREENVTEVAAGLALAYIGYFCADYVWETSGVIATVAAGVTVKYLGRAMVNDEKLLTDFWSLLEHLLNTVLFTLGGVVWGDLLVKSGSAIGRKEWGYLVVLYIMLTIIRLALFSMIYPVTRRIGLGTCWPEMLFQVHGGLRGAVGIALALSLDSQVSHIASGGELDPIYREQTQQVFGFVGGIAFMTLVINAPTCKPLLRYLRLSESTATRNRILDSYRAHFKRHALDTLVELLSQPRFRLVNFAIIKAHASFLSDVTKDQLMEAVDRHRQKSYMDDYAEPNLAGVLPCLPGETEAWTTADNGSDGSVDITMPMQSNVKAGTHKRTGRRFSSSTLRTMMREEPKDVKEFRILFLSILRSAYKLQIVQGELAERDFLTIALDQSLALAYDAVLAGKPLGDWKYVTLMGPTLLRWDRRVRGSPRLLGCLDRLVPGTRGRCHRALTRLDIERALAFMAAHRYAQGFLRREFEDADRELSEAGKMVVAESETQFLLAESLLKREDPRDVERVVSHKFCSILLSSSIIYVGTLVDDGLLREEEAEHWVRELEMELDCVMECDEMHGIGDSVKDAADSAPETDLEMPAGTKNSV